MAQILRRHHRRFRGVDFREVSRDLTRSPDSVNMWRDYRGRDCLSTRPSMVKRYPFSDPVTGVFFFQNKLIGISAGDAYAVDMDTGEKVLLEDGFLDNSFCFVHNDKLYLLGGGAYWVYDGTTIDEVAGYIPTTSIGRTPQGSGTAHEDVNLLTPWRKNTFRGDGTSPYYLDCRDCDDTMPTIKVDGVELTGDFQWFPREGKVTFGDPPDPPATDGQDNVEIIFRKAHEGREKINGCTLAALFDNRVFFSGNPQYPNTVWHSSLDDPTYVSDLDYYREGLDQAAVKALVPGNNALWVFREPSQANTNIFYHTPVLDADYGKVYPSVHSSIALGCVGKAVNFQDDILFFSPRGLEAVDGDVEARQALAHRSTLVDPRLAGRDYSGMVLQQWQGYLLVILGREVFLADSRDTFTQEGHREYSWYYWQLEKPVYAAAVHQGVLYLGSEDGVYTLDGTGDIPSHWTCPPDDLGQPSLYKTAHKRGCLGKARGDLTLQARDGAGPFLTLGTFAGVTQRFVARLRCKKFQAMELRLASATRFSLESLSFECFLGGHVKR